MVAEFLGELPDRRRLAGSVDADDEDHRRLRVQIDRRWPAEEARRLVAQCFAEVAEVATCLQTLDELGRGRNAHVRGDQRLLEPLPGLVVARIEGGGRELLGERPATLSERVA